MTEPKFDWRITDLSEIEIRGTDDVPIMVSRPYWSLVEMKYPNFTAVVHSGKKKFSHTFQSDDVETALKVIDGGGEEKEISKAIASNVVYVEKLMKHCMKLSTKTKRVKNKKPTAKRSKTKSKPRSTKEIKKELSDNFTIDLNKDLNIKLNNWM